MRACVHNNQKGGGNMTKSGELIARCERFQKELGIAVTKFCERVSLSTSSYYACRSGQLALSEETLTRIDEYLKRYGF